MVGGIISGFGSGGRLGAGEIMVAEACESDGTFLKLDPTISVVTSLEREHMDYYETQERLFDAFTAFANKVPFYGCVVMCLDQPNLQALIPKVRRRIVTYGTSVQSDIMASDIEQDGFTTRFTLTRRKDGKREQLGQIEIASPGRFSVQNALAAVTVGLELNLEFDEIEKGLKAYKRAGRRFEHKGTVGDVVVIEDYGHHPTEIKATLRAAKEGWDRRLLVLFQPHRFTRTRDLLTEFFTAFNDADILFVTPIYPASESAIEGIDSGLISSGVKKMGHKAVFLAEDVEDASRMVVEHARPNDMIIILGAGDIYKASEPILKGLNDKFGRKENASS